MPFTEVLAVHQSQCKEHLRSLPLPPPPRLLTHMAEFSPALAQVQLSLMIVGAAISHNAALTMRQPLC